MVDIKVKDLLTKFVDMVGSGSLPAKIAEITFPPLNCPAVKYSFNNRLLLALQGCLDARGKNQWNAVGRAVADKSKTVSILAPIVKHYSETDESGEERTQSFVSGFMTIQLYAKDNTYGMPLEYENLKLPSFKLLEVAESWGLKVNASPYIGGIMGVYDPSKKSITIASPTLKTFLHELAHASQDRLNQLKGKTKEWLELTAEISAMVIAELLGEPIEEVNPGATLSYIKMIVKSEDPLVIGKKVMKLVSDIEKIVKNIFSCVYPMEVKA
jgi:hypothetical protein